MMQLLLNTPRHFNRDRQLKQNVSKRVFQVRFRRDFPRYFP